MFIRPATVADIEHICRNLRPIDRHEVMAVRFNDDPDALVDDILMLGPRKLGLFALADAGREPVALVGAHLMTPTTAAASMIATARWNAIARPAHRWVRRVFMPAVLAPHVARAECRVWDGNTVARRWLRRLGFAEEGRAPALGRHGEAYVQCAWINPSWTFPEV
ncbi:hypothetical protein [Chelatococcus asaccharovorans]|uniref:RimJ/RimL family protein N-acetyltransferase n=1 Tax=Chelatococcus asaccharovorans TaxID=28210 RepID=A0A2V3UAH9_9HYPH|nr:hypothetical protein [Chelatococcus asaccharovorans]MBS7703184.1 hypothetical protein [Chelatococcus asaccharovorans]PXW61513.1 hypothetical protein C7450_10328 [Chelatococcus asaccharovorans]